MIPTGIIPTHQEQHKQVNHNKFLTCLEWPKRRDEFVNVHSSCNLRTYVRLIYTTRLIIRLSYKTKIYQFDVRIIIQQQVFLTAKELILKLVMKTQLTGLRSLCMIPDE